GLFKEVMVSTDNKEIADISIKYGASVPFIRSGKNSDDFATTASVIIEVIEEYKKAGEEFDNLCCIYPAAPFVTPVKLKDSFKLMTESQADSVIPVVKFSYPVQRALKIEDNKLKFLYPENAKKRSQDLEPVYHDAGQFYWCRVES